ncbi:hypothetical protein KC19_VG014200 [Ceratodon purpureus]|uniref:TF-B3 domain-containing protein n=1 Tax=Ceratodon purpureus TaxID=3225 RepID=A0A8T0HKX8_CERPU|nr:hypothetical protein KC19_VG014200 [Ceratodon purpureus]
MQEIPLSFTLKTGWPGSTLTKLVTSISTHREWPMELERPLHAEKGPWRSVGKGWADIVRDQRIGPESSLVFEVVDDSCLVVSVFHRLKVRSFTKTLRSSHFRGHSSKLDISTRFWRDTGVEQFEDQSYTLHGPLKVATVKTVVTRSPRQTWFFISSGWSRFCKANGLRVGDNVKFTCRESWHFDVNYVDSAEESI